MKLLERQEGAIIKRVMIIGSDTEHVWYDVADMKGELLDVYYNGMESHYSVAYTEHNLALFQRYQQALIENFETEPDDEELVCEFNYPAPEAYIERFAIGTDVFEEVDLSNNEGAARLLHSDSELI